MNDQPGKDRQHLEESLAARMTELAQANERLLDEIAARKRAQQEYHAIIAAAMDGFWITDTEGRFLDVNEAYCRLIGYSREELLTMRIPDIEAAEQAEDTARHIQRIMATGSDRFETRHRRKDGKIVDIEISVNHLPGDRGRLFVFARDITERKRAEAARAHLAAIVESSSDAIIGKDLDGIVTSWNSGAEKLYGYTAAEVIGRSGSILAPAGREHEILVLMEKIRSGESVAYYETVRTGKGGGQIDVSLTLSPIRDVMGNITGISTIAHDITKRIRAEEELRRYAAQLEAANKELEAFSYSVSHDLRTPLRAIDGFSRILLEDYQDRLDDEGKRLLNVVRDNTARMARLIDDILAFSRTGRLEMAEAEVDMEELARVAWEEFEPAAVGRRLELDIQPLPPAWGDRAMLRQALVNLMSNAVKFTRPKEVARIEVGGALDGKEIVYHVKDNGVGFDMQYAGKLFGVFQRLHGIEEFEGTGIGLAIVKRIVARHGGRVWAEGRVNEGATFYFALPAKEVGHD